MASVPGTWFGIVKTCKERQGWLRGLRKSQSTLWENLSNGISSEFWSTPWSVLWNYIEFFGELKDQGNEFAGWEPIKMHYNRPIMSSVLSKFFVNTCDFICSINFLKWTFCVKQEYILDLDRHSQIALQIIYSHLHFPNVKWKCCFPDTLFPHYDYQTF